MIRPKPRKTGMVKGRFRATSAEWIELAYEKTGPCRVCGRTDRLMQLHHVCPRSQLGDDVADNLIPLCPDCHEQVERRNRQARVQVRQSLTPAEFAYLRKKKGIGWVERHYPVEDAA